MTTGQIVAIVVGAWLVLGGVEACVVLERQACETTRQAALMATGTDMEPARSLVLADKCRAS